MSYCASTYRINFASLRRVRGSKDSRLLAELSHLYPDDEEDDDYEENEDRPPALSLALADIINGEVIEDASWPTYAEASGVLYQRFGTMLDANPISPSNPQFLQAVEAAFASAGIAQKLPMFDFSRVPPLLPEAPEPFPVLSHLTPEEVRAARGLIRTIDWGSQQSEVREAISMVDSWIDAAASHGEGLVCIYG